jgi:outer membrane protein TolC
MKRILFINVWAICCLFLQAQQLTLDECQTLAHNNYPLIKQYGLIEQTVEYSIANATKAYLPQVALSAQATYQSDVAAFPDQMTALYEQIGIRMKGLNRDQYRLTLEVNQTIWDGGITKAQKDIAKAEGDFSRQSLEVELYTLRDRINNLYFGILILSEQLRQNTLLQELLESNLKSVNAHVNNGTAMPSDVNVIKVELLAASQQRTQIESAKEAYCNILSVMTGKEIDSASTFAKPLPQSLVAKTNNRPELQLFNTQTEQFEAQKRALNATVMPRIGLFAQGFYGNPGLNLFKDMTENKWTWNYIAGVRFQWNIGNYYTLKGNIQKLSLAQQRVESQRETFLFNTDLATIQQRNAIEKMNRVMADDAEIIKLRTSIRETSEAKYANGTITVSELLRDIIAESQSMQSKALHEMEWLKNIYELIYTINNE